MFLLAGLGRCGTTYLCSVLNDKPHKFYSRIDDIPFNENIVYKTHDFAPLHIPRVCRAVFVFGDPRNIALSNYNECLKYKNWRETHGYNMHCTSDSLEDIFHYDIFRLGEHFYSWYRYHDNYDVACVRYETILDNIGSLQDFVGKKIKWTQWKTRKTDWKKSRFADQLDEVYGRIASDIEAVNDFIVL